MFSMAKSPSIFLGHPKSCRCCRRCLWAQRIVAKARRREAPDRDCLEEAESLKSRNFRGLWQIYHDISITY